MKSLPLRTQAPSQRGSARCGRKYPGSGRFGRCRGRRRAGSAALEVPEAHDGEGLTGRELIQLRVVGRELGKHLWVGGDPIGVACAAEAFDAGVGGTVDAVSG
jgi:hypothetical protein